MPPRRPFCTLFLGHYTSVGRSSSAAASISPNCAVAARCPASSVIVALGAISCSRASNSHRPRSRSARFAWIVSSWLASTPSSARSARRSRHIPMATRSVMNSSITPRGCTSVVTRLISSSNSPGSSPGRTGVDARSPWSSRFRLARRRPGSERAPVDFLAFARLARMRFESEVIVVQAGSSRWPWFRPDHLSAPVIESSASQDILFPLLSSGRKPAERGLSSAVCPDQARRLLGALRAIFRLSRPTFSDATERHFGTDVGSAINQ